MISDDLERKAKSIIWLSEHSDYDVIKAESRILEAFRSGDKLSDEEMDNYQQIIHSLKSSGYLRCGMTSKFQETFRTTEAGIDYLSRIRVKFGV